MMVRYTSILLPLAHSRKRRLEEVAQARGETLESFILDAAEAEAERIGQWLSEKGHSVDHPIYSSTVKRPRYSGSWKVDGERQIAADRVALELGWEEEHSDDWLDDVDRLIESVDALDHLAEMSGPGAEGQNSRRSLRRAVRSVQVLNPVQGTVLDMSETGLGVETHGPFAVPEKIHLSIGQAVASAKIRAEVRWCVLVRTESFNNGDVMPVYRSGLAFVGH